METADKLKSMINVYENNIDFMHKRIAIQNAPNYDKFAAYGGQWSEIQYYPIQIEREQAKLLAAKEKLSEINRKKQRDTEIIEQYECFDNANGATVGKDIVSIRNNPDLSNSQKVVDILVVLAVNFLLEGDINALDSDLFDFTNPVN